MNEKQKQEEIKKIIGVCEENGIQYNINKLDFIEKDTGQVVSLNIYALLVIGQNGILKVDGFYSSTRIHRYLQQAQADNEMNGIYEDNKEMVGYILVDKATNLKKYAEFYTLHKKVDAKKQKSEEPKAKKARLEEPQPSSSTTHDINNTLNSLTSSRSKLFKYLILHNYIVDTIKNNKSIMQLDVDKDSIENIKKNILKYFNNDIFLSEITYYINMFGFQWIDRKTLCCIPVDTKTFEEYYLPFHTLYKSMRYEDSANFLQSLYNFYKKHLSKYEADHTIEQLGIKGHFTHSLLLEKHATYPRASR